MKTKYAAIISAVLLGLAATLWAAEKQANSYGPQLIRIKSNGTTIGELRLMKGTTLKVEGSGGATVQVSSPSEGGNDASNVKEQVITYTDAKGGVTIRIEGNGGSPVTVKAGEIEIVTDKK